MNIFKLNVCHFKRRARFLDSEIPVLSEILQNGCTRGEKTVYSPTLIQEPWPFAGTINFTMYVDGSLLNIIIQYTILSASPIQKWNGLSLEET